MTQMMAQPTAAQPQTGATTQGEQLRCSPGVRRAIESIVREVEEKRSKITDVRGPLSPQLTQSFEDFMRKAGEVRGRALHYPYIGSGIGNGALVELMDGSVKYDLITGIGVNFFGHSEPDLVAAALNAAISDTPMQGHLLMNEEPVRFSMLLAELASKVSRLSRVFLCNSGVMANENALKMCYQKSGGVANRVIAFKDCFMGRTVTMSQIGDSAANRQGIPLSTLVDYMPFYDEAAARRMSAGDASGKARFIDMCVARLREYIERYPNQHACFIFELVQGEGGFNTAPREFFAELMKVCREAGIYVWDDEVQTFGRTETMFAFEGLGLAEYIDICCVGKLSQVCAVLFQPEMNPKPGLLSQTFLGSVDALHVGKRILERLADPANNYYGPGGRIARHHKLFREQVHTLAKKHPEWFPASADVVDVAGGSGGMMRFTPYGGKKDPVMKLCKAMFEEGVIAFYCGHGPWHVRMLPPLGVMEESAWPKIFAIIERAMMKAGQ